MPLHRLFFTAPPSDWLLFGMFFLGISGFIAMAEIARKKRGWAAEINRKIVHIGTGLLILWSPSLFQSAAPLLWMAMLFILINAWGVRTGHLKSMHDSGRISYGTILYPLSFGILTALCWTGHKAVLIPAIGVLAFGDAAAALFGENLRKTHTFKLAGDEKSLEGSAAMALISFMVVFFFLPLAVRWDHGTISMGKAALIALITMPVATALEALSSKGSDNLTAPLGAAFVIWFGLTQPADALQQLGIAMGLSLGVAWGSCKARFLTASGSTATFILATVIFGIGGWIWAVPILVFFILSSLLSKTGKKRKAQFDLRFEKSSQRDAGQVMANGGIAGVMVLGSLFYPHPFWYAAYLAALAAVTADTWGTEIGVFSRMKPRSILTMKSVESGTSGGVTLLGTLAALAGSALIAFSGRAMHPGLISWSLFISIAVAGLLASLVDSLLGATVQAQYECAVCRKQTERKIHCGDRPTVRISGWHRLNNDGVNALAALSGVILLQLWVSL